MPIALLWLDAPAGPQIEPTFDDRRCCRLEDYAAILPPPGMREPPLAERRRLFAAIIDDAIEVQVAEIIEAQEGRQTVDVMLTSDLALVRLEAQHQGPSAVEHHAIFGVELRKQLFGFFLCLPPLLLLCRLFLGVSLPRSLIDHQLFEGVGAQGELFGCSLALALVFDDGEFRQACDLGVDCGIAAAIGLGFWFAAVPSPLELPLVNVGASSPFAGRGWVGEDCRACFFIGLPFGMAVQHEAEAVAAGAFVARLAESFAQDLIRTVGL